MNDGDNSTKVKNVMARSGEGLLGILIVSLVHEVNMIQITPGRKTPEGW